MWRLKSPAWSVPLSWAALGTLALWVFLFSGIALAAEEPCRPTLVERQRYGFVATSVGWPQRFDVAQLQAGWYVDFRPNASRPSGMDRALVLNVSAGQAIDPSTLGPLVDDNPGSLWLIGNEPDCIWQDNVLPEEYARIYHDFYYFIKGRDLTSQIAAGSIVQPTPLRLQYLDRVLSGYRARYHHAMPVDVWNIHNAILNEVQGGWGAEIPPGISATHGELREIDDNDDMAIFENQIWEFRRWMDDRGYSGHPLIVTEYGILMPDDFGFDADRVNAFMSNTFDFFLTATDPELGDPTDDHRLVQRWAWFSLDVEPYNPVTGAGFNGNLFNPDTTEVTPFGQHYAGHTSSFPPLAYVDLGLATWDAPAPPLVVSPTETITYSLQVRIANKGTANSGSFSVRLAHDGPVSGTLTHEILNLAPISSQWLSFTLTGLRAGAYGLTLEIDPEGQVDEATKCDNLAIRTLGVSDHRVHLPLIHNRGVPAAFESESAVPRSSSGGSVIEPVELSEPVAPAGAGSGFREFQMPTESSYPAQLALDPVRGVLWVAQRDGNKIACFDYQHEVWCDQAEYEIETPHSEPWGVAVDAAGNVWFAASGVDRIGQLDVTSGMITEYPLEPGSEPWGMALQGDAVWCTERTGNKIARLDPATGEITEYPLETPAGMPSGIAVQGNRLWFTETASNKLGTLSLSTPDASVEELLRPPGTRPQDITLTSEGNPWFAEETGNRIVLFILETAFRWTEVDAATPNSEPYGIAMEGDTAVWFTERAANKLGRFTGTIPPREYLLPSGESLPTDIVVDDDGCAWYTAPGANRIGRLCLPLDTSGTYLPLVLRRKTMDLGR